MPKQTYEVCEEMNKIVRDLCDQRADLFQKVSPSMIQGLVRTDKVAPASNKDVLKIKGIRGVSAALTDKSYVIYGYESQWEILTSSKKVAHVAFLLKQIDTPSDDDENKLAEKGQVWEWGKLVKPDFTSFKSFARVYGIDWEDEVEVPNVLADREISF